MSDKTAIVIAVVFLLVVLFMTWPLQPHLLKKRIDQLHQRMDRYELEP